jgi:hypothetical protein
MKPPQPQQRGLFDELGFRVSGVKRTMKLVLNRVAAESALSREEILIRAREMAEAEGVKLSGGNGGLSLTILDKWLNPNALSYMPDFEALIILCRVLGDSRAINPFLEALGLEVMTPNDRKYRDLGKLESELKCLRKKKRQIEETV